MMYVLASVIYLCLTIFTSLKISKSIILSSRRKTIHIILNALIPVLWYYLVSPVIFPKARVITRAEREKMIARESGSRLEDGTTNF